MILIFSLHNHVLWLVIMCGKFTRCRSHLPSASSAADPLAKTLSLLGRAIPSLCTYPSGWSRSSARGRKSREEMDKVGSRLGWRERDGEEAEGSPVSISLAGPTLQNN